MIPIHFLSHFMFGFITSVSKKFHNNWSYLRKCAVHKLYRAYNISCKSVDHSVGMQTSMSGPARCSSTACWVSSLFSSPCFLFRSHLLWKTFTGPLNLWYGVTFYFCSYVYIHYWSIAEKLWNLRSPRVSKKLLRLIFFFSMSHIEVLLPVL